jgi:hypothetical protein
MFLKQISISISPIEKDGTFISLVVRRPKAKNLLEMVFIIKKEYYSASKSCIT